LNQLMVPEQEPCATWMMIISIRLGPIAVRVVVTRPVPGDMAVVGPDLGGVDLRHLHVLRGEL
jgi:hypothetical protein